MRERIKDITRDGHGESAPSVAHAPPAIVAAHYRGVASQAQVEHGGKVDLAMG
jgi:hypothetical protein